MLGEVEITKLLKISQIDCRISLDGLLDFGFLLHDRPLLQERDGVRLNPDAPEKHRQEVAIAGSMRGRIRGQLQIGKDIRVELQFPPNPNEDFTTPGGSQFQDTFEITGLPS